jgi:hypothetical protein
MSDEEYRAVTVTVQQLRPDSVMVEVPYLPGWQSIPRSLIHGGDEIKIVRWQHGFPREMTFRILAFKADQLHLA